MQSVILGTSPAAAMLGFLALRAKIGCSVPRALIADKVWPGLPETQARRALSDTLYHLRQTLHDTSWLESHNGMLRLAGVRIDVDEFSAGVARDNLIVQQQALDLYQGDLLEDLDADWLLLPRLSLHELYLTALSRTCAALAAVNQPDTALAYARRWVLMDPYNEEAHCAFMRFAACRGHYATALKQYEQLATLLDSELQTVPLPETQALAASIRSEYHAFKQPFFPPSQMVGRSSERATLLAYAQQMQNGHGQCVLVEGEAGIGKTHLLEAFADGVTWRGMRVVWGKARATEPAQSLSLLQIALTNALTGPVVEQIATGLASATHEVAARCAQHREQAPLLARSVGEMRVARGASGVFAAPTPTQYIEIFRALSTLQPHVLIFEDVQWADRCFWDVFPTLAACSRTQRLLIIVSYRKAELQRNSVAWRALEALDHNNAPHRITLSGLTIDQCAMLAQCFGIALDETARAALFQRTGGNPFFTQQWLLDSTQGTATLHRHLDEQLALLTPVAYAALEAGAILDSTFTYISWQELIGNHIYTAATELVEHQFLDETAQGYRFRHMIVRDHVYSRIAAQRRQFLRDRSVANGCLHSDSGISGASNAPQAIQRSDAPRHVIAHLVRADIPLGRALTKEDRVRVRWTVDAGTPDAVLLRRAGKVALRRHRIMRLVDEACVQGGIPTDQDLADALAVTVRTIGADIIALQVTGYSVATRRRRRVTKT